MQVNHEAIVALALASSEGVLNKMKAGQEVTPLEMKNTSIYVEKAMELLSVDALLLAVAVTAAARAKNGQI
jgi:hypothetical protein